MSNTDVGYGQQTPEDSNSDSQVLEFAVRQITAQFSTMKIVKVTAVNAGSGTPPVAGTVDVQILVNQADGGGNSTPHGIVKGIPYIRLCAGKWQIVADPAVDDIGIMVCADRDSSSVVRTKAQANPGSGRVFDAADGVYIGGILNAVPSATFWLKSDGTLNLTDANGNVIQTSGSGFALTTASGGDFTVNGISVLNHTHAVTDAPGETGPPVG